MVSSLISSVRGSLEGIGPDWVDVLIGGVTFRVNVPASTIDHLGQIGEPVRLHTSLQVREDNLTLYGFLTSDMRRAFVTLLGISGVGPRLALAIMSRFTPDSLALAVSVADTDAFSAVSGVGKKTASRIVLELKGKLDGMAMRVPVPCGSITDFVCELKKSTTVDQINSAMKKAASGKLKGILEYTEEPIVSVDILTNPHSSIFDAQLTHVMDGNFVKVISWYDNEWGYSNRTIDVVKLVGK